MSPLPHNAKTIDLLKWVATHPNQAFDPIMVVTIPTGHTSDWEWQAVLGQMEDLQRQGYILRLKQDPSGSTYWTITTTGTNYLHALERFENPQPSEPVPPIAVHGAPAAAAGVLIPIEPPVPSPKKHVAPFLERTMLRFGHIIHWEEMPTHLTAHLTYDVLKYLVLLAITALVGGVSLSLYYLIHFLIKRALIRAS
jgi:hypothetical protein